MRDLSESELLMEKLKALLHTYEQLMRMHTEPGEKAHKLWNSIEWLERQIKKLL